MIPFLVLPIVTREAGEEDSGDEALVKSCFQVAVDGENAVIVHEGDVAEIFCFVISEKRIEDIFHSRSQEICEMRGMFVVHG